MCLKEKTIQDLIANKFKIENLFQFEVWKCGEWYLYGD